MSAAILPVPNVLFDLRMLLKGAIERQGDNQLPLSPSVSEASSALPSLTPSPELGPSLASSQSQPPALFLDPHQTTSTPPPKQKQKKKSKKVTPLHRQARKTAAANASRKERRARQVDKLVKARPQARIKHLGQARPLIFDKINTQELSAASTGYIGYEDFPPNRQSLTLEDAIRKHNLVLQEWDGSFSAGVVDNQNRVIAILAGHPDDPDWPLLHAQAAEALESCRARCKTGNGMRQHRRGQFIALNCGVSYGGGQQVPGNLRHGPENDAVLSELNSLPIFKRIAGFASSVLATWAPKLYEYYRMKTEQLHQKHPNLVRNFPNSIFSAVTYNFGPRTVCYKHIDPGNLAFGECSVTPFGPYNYKKGGHLILWDLKLVIEFPPGCTILFPSAVIAHSNVAIAKHERRYSFAQYSAGGLFRWVDQGFQTQDQHRESLSVEGLAKDKAGLDGMWEFGLSLFPTAYAPLSSTEIGTDN